MEARMAESGKITTENNGLADRVRHALSGPSAGTWFAGTALFAVVAFSVGSWLGNFTRPVAPMTFSGRDPKVESDGVSSSTKIMVHVVGAVKTPGVVRLKAGDRVADAINAAGGAWTNAATDALNMAAKVEDGQKIIVPKRGTVVLPVSAGIAPAMPTRLSHRRPARTALDDGIPVVPPGVMELTPLPTPGPPAAVAEGSPRGAEKSDANSTTEAGGMVNLNSANQTQLETLPGVGPKTAQAILEYRRDNGPFASVDDIINVKGIGPKKLEKMRPFLRL